MTSKQSAATNSWCLHIDLATDDSKADIVTHAWPHLDEVVAMYMIHRVGTYEFRNKYVSRDNNLYLGTEGGPFDEHPRAGEPRKKHECATTLVAKALGIFTKPEWQQIIKFAHFADTGEAMNEQYSGPEEANHPFDLNNRLRLQWRRLKAEKGVAKATQEAHIVIEAIFDELDTFLWSQEEFQWAREAIKQGGRRNQIMGPNGKPINLICVTSDNTQVNAAARRFFAAHLVVQRNTTGHVHIFTRQDAELNLQKLVELVNREEQQLANDIRVTESQLLRAEGMIAGGRWFYFAPNDNIQQLHNSTEQYPDVPATRITDERLLELIQEAMQPAAAVSAT